jgi:hypothetical protein
MPWEDNTYTPCWKMMDEDVWNFDQTLALFLGEGLAKLAVMDHGYPGYMTYESWIEQLNFHSKKFLDYGNNNSVYDREDISGSLLWLGHNYGHLWD